MKATTTNYEFRDQLEIFIKRQLQERSYDDIEYIGINLSNNDNITPVFKCYFSTKESLRTTYPLLYDFQKRDMIRALNKINDTIFPDQTRYEIGLKNRNNANMQWLYEWLGSAFPISSDQKREIHSMAELSCCNLPEYRHSALYFLGFITDSQKILPLSAIKLHYLLRTCKDPDNIGTNYYVDTTERLCFLQGSKIIPLSVLANAAKMLLDSADGIELWMVAMDFFINRKAKYKIYIKTVGGDLLNPLKLLMFRQKLEHLSHQLDAYEEYLINHPEHKLYGVAICTTTQGDWLLNLYQTIEA